MINLRGLPSALLIFVCVMTSVLLPKLALASVTRFTTSDRDERMQLIRRGLLGQLTKPEERAEYHLLLCQPKLAWTFAEKIQSDLERKRFEGTILALAATPRVESAPESIEDLSLDQALPQPVVAQDKIAMQYQLDSSEIWDDELDNLAVEPTCDFPTVDDAQKKKLSALASDRLAASLLQSGRMRSDLAALASDVGLKPILTDAELAHLIAENSTYVERLTVFATSSTDNNNRNPARSQPGILIQGFHANVADFALQDLVLEPHSLELPWLLRRENE